MVRIDFWECLCCRGKNKTCLRNKRIEALASCQEPEEWNVIGVGGDGGQIPVLRGPRSLVLPGVEVSVGESL